MEFFKKHQKKILGVISIVAMVFFGISSGNWNPYNSNPVVATIRNDNIRLEDMNNSRRLWTILKHTEIAHMSSAREDQVVRASALLGIGEQMIDQDPDSFCLLQKEAANMGLVASPDSVNELMRNQVTLNESSSTEEVRSTELAFGALMQVQAAYLRASGALKTTAPERQFYMATLGQSITLRYVSYSADEFKSAVPAPTAEQLKEQFDKYKNSLADQADQETNPFGFGYEYPNRVKMEFLSIIRADLHKAVLKSKDDATWEIDARKEYLRNDFAYPTSRPSEPSTRPTTSPTTRPLGFADYKEKIINQLVEDAQAKLLDEVEKKINSTMAADWAAYRSSVNPTTQPTTQPAAGPMTVLGVPYGSPEYLPKLALLIQKDFGLLPQVNRYAKDMMSAKELSLLPVVGSAELISDDFRVPSLTLSEYTMNFLDAFGHQRNSRDAAATLSILSPSPELKDLTGNVHYFRVIAAEPAHPAASMAPFAAQVEADYRLAAAERKAKEQVDKLAAIAKAKGLDSAAADVGRKIFLTGKILGRGTSPMPELSLKPASELILRKAAFDMLKGREELKSGKALAVVELPLEGKVLLVSPAEVAPMWSTDNLFRVEFSLSHELVQQADQLFRSHWFDPKDIKKRLDYQSVEKKKDSSAPGTPPPM